MRFTCEKVRKLGRSFHAKLDAGIAYFFENEKTRWGAFLFLLLLLGVGMYVLNAHTLLVADDYNYSFSWQSGKRITNWKDALQSQYRHYFVQNGRALTHFLAQLFLMWDKAVFNILNSVVFVAFVLVLYLHAAGRGRPRPLVLLMIMMSMFLFSPAFGQSYLWVTGSSNYLWGSLVVFAFLLPYRFQLEVDEPVLCNPWGCLLFVMAGGVAGWMLENMTVALCVLILLSGVLLWTKWKRWYGWELCGFVGVLAGAGFLLLSPGSLERAMQGGFKYNFIGNFVDITAFFVKADTLLLPVSCLLALWLVCDTDIKRKRWPVTLFYTMGMLASMYCMILPPVFPARARANSVLFCVIAFCDLFRHCDFSLTKRRELLAILSVVLFSVWGGTFRCAYKDIRDYERRGRARIEYMLGEKSKGRPDVAIPHNYACTRYCAAWRLEDINENPKHWTSAPVAKYYGLRSVRTRPYIVLERKEERMKTAY